MSKNYQGQRNDIDHYTNNTYDTNICRIFQYENKKYGYIKNNNNVLIKDIDGFLSNKETYLLIKINFNEKTINLVDNIKNNLNTNNIQIISLKNNYLNDYKFIDYSELEKKYKPLIPLWEDKNQNIKNKPDIYTKKWEIGEKEKKRKYPRFFKVHDNYLKIGILWNKPIIGGYKGRPKDKDNNFVDNFRIKNKYGKILKENSNWGTILVQIQQIIKLNPYEYYNNNHRLIIEAHSKKINKWWKIVEFDTIKNYWY